MEEALAINFAGMTISSTERERGRETETEEWETPNAKEVAMRHMRACGIDNPTRYTWNVVKRTRMMDLLYVIMGDCMLNLRDPMTLKRYPHAIEMERYEPAPSRIGDSDRKACVWSVERGHGEGIVVIVRTGGYAEPCVTEIARALQSLGVEIRMG